MIGNYNVVIDTEAFECAIKDRDVEYFATYFPKMKVVEVQGLFEGSLVAEFYDSNTSFNVVPKH